MNRSIASLLLQEADGTETNLESIGLFLREFEVSPLIPRHEIEKTDGTDGQVILNTTFESRSIRALFLLESVSKERFIVNRDKVFNLFNGKPFYHIVHTDDPYKRWHVKVARQSFERIGNAANVEINFISESPYAESIITTLNQDNAEVVHQVETEEMIQYIFSQSTFMVWNDGDVDVDPTSNWSQLTIEFRGASDNLTLRNLTTGDEWSYGGSTVEGDVIRLEGVRSFKNGDSIFGDTNRKLLTLVPGRNDFEVTGATGPFSISFDFKFYYI